jgi:putative addiction module component (TIGR02574 family)
MAKQKIDISNLTTDERLDLIEEPWDSLATNSKQVRLTEDQLAELDRRLDEVEQRRWSAPGPN